MINELPCIWDKIKNSQKPIFLYGMGDGAEKIMHILDNLHIRVCGIFASDDFVRGQIFSGHTVQKYSDIIKNHRDIIVLLAFGTNRPDIISKIDNIAKEQELYVPDLPVAGDGYYTVDFFAEHGKAISEVYDLLSDENSKKLFLNVLKFKKTGDISFLLDNNERDYLSFGDNEIFVDCGAYDGDTVLEFAENSDNYKHIYAIEPDPKNFAKLLKNTAHLQNITCFNLAVHSSSSALPFTASSGRNSIVGDDGNRPAEQQAEYSGGSPSAPTTHNNRKNSKTNVIPANSIDNILDSREATYIKLDVEGNEHNAVLGTKQTIIKYKPKLQISTYHRTNDIFELPLLIKNIRSDYNVYFTKKTYYPPWDSYFIFI